VSSCETEDRPWSNCKGARPLDGICETKSILVGPFTGIQCCNRAEGEGEMSNGKKWTSEEDERLLDLKAKGLKLRMIAKRLNRTASSVDSRLTALRKAKVK
jgi:hypothetical protein